MKKLFLFSIAFVVASFSLCAQTNNVANIKNIKEINFYGVDFSLVKTYGLKETSVQIKSGLSAINSLFISEQNKYNVGKFLKKEVLNYNTDATDEHNEKLDKSKFISKTNEIEELSSDDVHNILNDLSTGENNRTGLVFIAELLDKTKASATFYVVFFDEATKDILYSKEVSAKPRGFGVRNYWAAAILNILKNWKY